MLTALTRVLPRLHHRPRHRNFPILGRTCPDTYMQLPHPLRHSYIASFTIPVLVLIFPPLGLVLEQAGWFAVVVGEG